MRVQSVMVHRYRCAQCERTFRHYPVGVTGAKHSQRFVALLAELWGAGLSLRWVERRLPVVGLASSDPSVWRAVQQVSAGLRRMAPGQVRVLGVAGPGLRRAGQAVGVLVPVDTGTGRVVGLAVGDEREVTTVLRWLTPMIAATVSSGGSLDLATPLLTLQDLSPAAACRAHDSPTACEAVTCSYGP